MWCSAVAAIIGMERFLEVGSEALLANNLLARSFSV